jgi:5-methylcytosine-specific restriction enzyme subunit McrC
MLRYAIGLAKIIPDYFELSEEANYYDIIVLFFLQELEKLLFHGLNTGYKIYEDNLSCIRGKILFKEHLNHNYNRNDKIFCSYSELTPDILENRIIKYTLYYLSQGYFLDDTIDSKLLNYYNRLDQINLIPSLSSSDSFKTIEYTPLNEHYRTILALCELLLRDSSLDEETLVGKKTAISFLVDMNVLFEKFVVRLFEERIKTEKLNVEEQKVRYADITSNELKLKLDIFISYNKKPILILDTKYKEFEGSPEISHVAQLTLYSNSTGVKNCCLIYAGKPKAETHSYFLHQGIKLYILSFDLQASNRYEFENKCNNFINSVNSLLQPMIEEKEEEES